MADGKVKYKLDRWLSFLTAALQYRGEYHNHKENMSWVVTTLYMPVIIAWDMD